MKVTIKKLLSGIIIPLSIVYLNYLHIDVFFNTVLGSIATVFVNLAALSLCFILFNQHKTYKFKVAFEFVPLCCIGIGIEGGSIGIILPFCVIAFGWQDQGTLIWDPWGGEVKKSQEVEEPII